MNYKTAAAQTNLLHTRKLLKSREYCIRVARLVRRDANDILDIDSQRSLYESVNLKRDHCKDSLQASSTLKNHFALQQTVAKGKKDP